MVEQGFHKTEVVSSILTPGTEKIKCGGSLARFKAPPCHGGDQGFKSLSPRKIRFNVYEPPEIRTLFFYSFSSQEFLFLPFLFL